MPEPPSTPGYGRFAKPDPLPSIRKRWYSPWVPRRDPPFDPRRTVRGSNWSLETFPDLSGVQTAIGGGPTLVRNGRPMAWSGFLLRHPRTAIGWNDEHLFLVEVDGRQPDLSVGMTFPNWPSTW